MAYRVDRLPGDDHRHHGGLAGPGRELQGQPRQPRVGPGVGRFEVVEEGLRAGAETRRGFGEPDQRFDRLDLAEEGPKAAEAVVAPVPQQAGRLRGDAPMARVRQRPPPVHVATELVDDGRRIVLLGLRGNPGAIPELQRVLGAGGLAFPGLRDGGDELGPPAPVDEPVGRLPLRVELPMAGGVLVRGVDDRMGEEAVGHGWLRSRFALCPPGLGPGAWGSGLRVPVSGVQVSGSRIRGPDPGVPIPAPCLSYPHRARSGSGIRGGRGAFELDSGVVVVADALGAPPQSGEAARRIEPSGGEIGPAFLLQELPDPRRLVLQVALEPVEAPAPVGELLVDPAGRA